MRRHRRKSKVQPGEGVNLSLMITPMLDMAFQLLAYFIMTYHPPTFEEGYIEGALLPPRVEKDKDKDKKNVDPLQPAPPPVDETPSLNDSVPVILHTLSGDDEIKEQPLVNGEPRLVEIRLPEETITVSGERSVFSTWKKGPHDALTDAEKTERDELVKKYVERLAADVKQKLKDKIAKRAETDIRLEADPSVKYRYVMAIYDACKTAGFENIRFVAPAKSGGGK